MPASAASLLDVSLGAYPAGMAVLNLRAWNAAGELVKDTNHDDATGEGPDFYLQQLLHIDGVVCAEVSDGHALHQRCDAGVEFGAVVRGA